MTEIYGDHPTSTKEDRADRRSWWQAMRRGGAKKCPQCGRGSLFEGYLTTVETCKNCDLHIAGHKADDAPPYLTIMIVGHALIPLALAAKQLLDPPLSLQFAFWLPAMVISAAWLLPVTKGAMVGLQWANQMHGFGDGDEVSSQY